MCRHLAVQIVNAVRLAMLRSVLVSQGILAYHRNVDQNVSRAQNAHHLRHVSTSNVKILVLEPVVEMLNAA